jgi:hypothetical protein
MITREQYDNAVKIRANGYKCINLNISCCCIGDLSIECGHSPGYGIPAPLVNARKNAIDTVIATYESAHPEEFGPGEGWRLLEKGETIKEGDEILMHDGWKVALIAGKMVKDAMFRRRISKPRIYTYEDVNLPEVQALVGKMVYASDCLERIITSPENRRVLDKIGTDAYPFVAGRAYWQFIRAIDPIRLTRAELIAIAAKERGVNPEQIVVEEAPDGR